MTLISIVVLSLYSNILYAIGNRVNIDPMMYGACYQLNTETVDSPQIVLSTPHDPIYLEKYGFQTSENESSINCIWFTSNEYAQSATKLNMGKAEQAFNNNHIIQQLSSGHQPLIHCNNRVIRIHKSDVTSKHLCSDWCGIEQGQPCFQLLLSTQNIPLTYGGESNVSPYVPSMFGISGVCIAFIVVCAVIYCFGVRYSRWSQQKSGNETEKVIDDVLEEIAKYTIGDDEEEGFYDDWNEYGDSDPADSSHSVEEALGRTILRVVSNQHIPELYSSSESSTESDEEQRRQDLEMAKETLYAVSYGTHNPYTKLETIDELNRDSTPKKSPLLDECEWDDQKVSSDGSNSALP